MGQGDIFLYFQAVTGLLGGPIAGLFLIGIFIEKADSRAAWIGFITSIFVAFYVGNPMSVMSIFSWYKQPEIFEFLISLVIIGSCLIPAWIMSLLKIEKNIKVDNTI